MIDDRAVREWNFGEIVHAYTQRDTMLYALGIGMGMGMGANALNTGQLRFVYESQLQAVPTMAAVLGTPGFWWRDPRAGVDFVKVVHGEQRLQIFKPLPPAATLVAHNKVLAITDKGSGKGAIVTISRTLIDQASKEVLAEGTSVSFLRGDGGFSDKSGVSDPAPESLPPVPEGAPDEVVELASLEQQALIYRLSGDYNALHADPDVAGKAGFERPILHGLCTYGMAAHAVLKAACAYDARRLRGLAVRFTSPVFPGETVRFEMWRRGDAGLHLRARIPARDVTVLNNGVVDLA